MIYDPDEEKTKEQAHEKTARKGGRCFAGQKQAMNSEKEVS